MSPDDEKDKMKEEDMAINFFLKKREEASFLCQWYMGE
jgi:hypothetical protein